MTADGYPKPNLSRTAEEVTEPHEEGVVVHLADEQSMPALAMPGEANADTVRLLLDGENSRGSCALIEYTIAPRGNGPGLHWHRTFDEYFYVVSGQLSTQAGGRYAVFGPRDFVFVPRGVIHDFWNETDSPCVFLSGWTPAGSEGVWKLNDAPELLRNDPASMYALLESLIDAVPVDTPRLGPT